MRLTFIASIGLFALMSCNDTATTSENADSTNAAETANYVYTIDHPDTWEWGSKKNTEIALKALKGFETGDIAGTMEYWGDSVKMQFDNYDETLSHDSLLSTFTRWRGMSTDMKVIMQDFESVKSKERDEEWVTIWYKQISTDAKGAIDSVECVDDLLFKDGKIILLDEKTRKLGPPKM